MANFQHDSILSETIITTLAALILPLIFIFLMKKKSKSATVNLPPGPKKLPIIGNLHLMSQPQMRCFRDLAKRYGPIMHLKLGEVDAVVISSPEIAKEILRDNDPVFADRPESDALKIFWYNYIDLAFAHYGDYWRQTRKICITHLLSNKMVRSMSSIREYEASRLVESIRHLGEVHPFNLTEKVFSFMSSVSCRASFGMVCEDRETLTRLVTQGLDMGFGFAIADVFPSSKIAKVLSWGTKMRLMRMRRKLDLILDDVIRKHENNGKGRNGQFGDDDFVDVLLRIKESGELQFPIGYDNIKALLFDMFAAGTQTSASTVDWAMVELMRNPVVMAKVQAELRQVVMNNSFEEGDIKKLYYLKLVIMETLRLHPQASIIPRASRESCEIRGYTIPEKVKVMVNAWAIHTDPKYWEDPETFEPERFQNQPSLDFTGSNFRYLPFGSGRRMCAGPSLAYTNVALTLAHLLYNFNWKLPEGVDAQSMKMIEGSGISTYRKEKLFVIATPYELDC